MPRNKTRDTSYRWNTRLAGALHSQLSYFEVLTRNAMNNALQDWNDKEKGSRDWCQMRVFGTGVLGTRYCRVPGSWYRAEGYVGPGR